MAEKVIKVCDRCGKERKSKIQPKLIINKGIDMFLGRTRYETQILCDDCEKSLIEWFNRKHYAIERIDKLEKIEQITNKWMSLDEKPNFCMMQIREVLENEN